MDRFYLFFVIWPLYFSIYGLTLPASGADRINGSLYSSNLKPET